jgi:hypothetical protein
MMRNIKQAVQVSFAILAVSFVFTGIPKASISLGETVEAVIKQQENPYAQADITIRIIPSLHDTFGYDILLRGKLLVHQPNIPGLPGNNGFSTKQKAKTVAEFVVKKIRNNEIPPTVTIEDLNKMGVLN